MAQQITVRDFSREEMYVYDNFKLKNDLNAINILKAVTNNKYEELHLKDPYKTVIFPADKTVYCLFTWFNLCFVNIISGTYTNENIKFICSYLASTIKQLTPSYRVANLANFRVYLYLPTASVPDTTWTNHGSVQITIFNEPIIGFEYMKQFVFNEKFEVVENAILNPPIFQTFNSASQAIGQSHAQQSPLIQPALFQSHQAQAQQSPQLQNQAQQSPQLQNQAQQSPQLQNQAQQSSHLFGTQPQNNYTFNPLAFGNNFGAFNATPNQSFGFQVNNQNVANPFNKK
jgi:hypothetical protein